ncbi:ABC transporter substrate-binding protein [Lysinibacillus odysseyi]|uniref:ABC transporter substrate-binding protein n=1 Tax=Lysinibacillus odysseyi 34hs-1 = NBRC 100172 TaxID=1220589 RepID=A0A0A3IEB6_9BACI|nr:ABC transporter substrate-binding protein [Lysinibacillus odysseyi]KGR81765.1 ABC transporter substrate-binding protein [Lysinibacillus odysseyi 34hs-1 = NBRC 100172]
MAKNKWRYATAASLLTLTLALAACNNESTDKKDSTETEQTEKTDVKDVRTLTDALGNEVAVPVHPKRVIATYLEDYLVALGIKPVAQWSVGEGASIQDYLQDSLEEVPTIGFDLPYEAVQSFKPDLILMDSASMVEGNKYSQYSAIAPTYVVGKENDNDWREELLTVGEVFDKKDDAQAILDDYDAKVKTAKADIDAAVGDASVAAIWLVGGSFYLVSDELSSGAVLYEDLGFKAPAVVKEIAASGTASWNAVSLEKLVELDADYIFLINSDNAGSPSTVSDALWNTIPAVKEGNVFAFSPESSWLYTGPIANSQIIDDVVKSVGK